MKNSNLIVLTLLVLLNSCTTLYMKKSGEVAEEVTRSINSGNSELPAQWSTVPFIFDGEILVTNSIVNTLWDGLIENGFTIENPEITSIEPLEPEDYAIFRKSWEMEVFFKSRIPDYTYKVSIAGISGEMIILIYRNDKREYSILGIKVDSK